MIFGRLELMLTKDPTLREGSLIDPKSKSFPVHRDASGFAYILNSSDLYLLEYADEMRDIGIDSFGIDVRRRSAGLCRLLVKALESGGESYKRDIERSCGSITTGHYLRGVL